MKILAIKWRRLGDTVLWTSALEALQGFFPSASIDLALDAAYLPLFENDPRWAHLHGLKRGTEAAFRSLKRWRKRRFDLVLNFHASSRSALLTHLSGGKETLIHHHDRDGKKAWFSRSIPHLGKPAPAFERDLNVVRALGWNGVAPLPYINSPSHFLELGKRHLVERGWTVEKPLVLVGLGASRPAKRWPIERYEQLIHRLNDRAQIGVLFESSAVFAPYPEMEARITSSALRVHTPQLADLMGTLPHASLYVGADSGVKHLAIALGVPTLTLFGPESIGEWHGYPLDQNPVIQKPVLCRNNHRENPAFAWCGEDRCPLSSHACLNQISVDEVYEEALRLISGPHHLPSAPPHFPV